MKKFFYLAMALSLVACQAEKVDVGGDMGGDGEKNYISVNILSANAGTRANEEYPANGGQYVDGEGAENAVENVRFYFFNNDADGTAARVIEGTKSYYDITMDGDKTDHPNSVEKILETVIVIDVNNRGDIADNTVSVVAVLNPPANLPTGPSLKQLNEVLDNYVANSTSFIMSNSIYATKDGANMKLFEAVSLEGHIHPDAASAKSNPVNIYVERVLAKVSLTTNLELFTDFQPKEVGGTAPTIPNAFVAKNKTGVDASEDIVIGGEPVYVRLLGWNVTATANQSYLMKHIDPLWNENLFGEYQPWNWEGHRSFWAINPNGTNVVYGPFEPKDGETNIAKAITGFTAPTSTNAPANFTYVQENAAVGTTGTYPNATANPTQVIIAAQLLDEYGDPLTVAEYAGTLYAGTEDVKKLYANALSNVWVEVTGTSSDDDDSAVQAGPGQRKFVKVGPGNIDFKTATAAGKASETKEGRYYVYAELAPTSVNGDAKEYKYYTLTPVADGFTATEANVGEVNDALMNLGHAKVWNEGLTYYYFDIRHLNNTALTKQGDETDYDAQLRTPGYFGVVRNHVYESKVTGVYGLGTPVYDPGEVIIPEKPDNDNTVIAAQIEILSWRVVNNNYELVW